MTNAEKYLKAGVREELISDLANYIRIHNTDTRSYLDILHAYFDKPIKPTLTEDEKVILRNIKKGYITVARDKAGDLFIATECDENGIRGHNALEFNRCLFQFIQDGEEYPIKELLK